MEQKQKVHSILGIEQQINLLVEIRNLIMIIDDNPIDQMITRHILRTVYEQNNIVIMGSADKAIDYLDNCHDLKTLPSLILLDLDMPGINGFGFLEKFNDYDDNIKKNCKIVVLTGSDITEDLELIEENSFVSSVVIKPLRKHSLTTMI